MARVIRWALLALAAFAVARAEDAPAEEAGSCVEPSLVAGFEAKLSALEDAKAALTLQLDAETAARVEQTQQCKAQTAALAADAQRLEAESAACVEGKQALMEQVAKEHETIVAKVLAEVTALKGTVEALEKQVEAQDAASAKDREALQAAEGKLAKAAEKTARLERDVQASRQKNDKLRGELEQAKGVEVTLSALLSSYYDEGVTLAEQAAELAREQLEGSSETIEQARASLEAATATVGEATSKFYADNLAASMDPVLADVHAAVEPHMLKLSPLSLLVKRKAAHVQAAAADASTQLLRRAKAARLEAIALLQENEHVAVHAQKVVDGLLLALLVPLVLLQLRLALRLLWWSLRTAVCVSTCGLCCRGGRGGGSKKVKRKTSKKMMASLTSPAAAAVATGAGAKTSKMSTTATTTTTKRSTRKGK